MMTTFIFLFSVGIYFLIKAESARSRRNLERFRDRQWFFYNREVFVNQFIGFTILALIILLNFFAGCITIDFK